MKSHDSLAVGFILRSRCLLGAATNNLFVLGFRLLLAPITIPFTFVMRESYRYRTNGPAPTRNRSKLKKGSPATAQFLLYLFLDAKNCDALVGDLEEGYRIIRKKFGARKANFWYWVQVITSVGPIAWAATKKLLKAISGVAALVEVWRRIRS